jgi:uncharacterized membrane protein YozB (DUF420 family)
MNGFLGTGATFAADLNLVVQLIMGTVLIAGTVLAKRKCYRAHGVCQTTVLFLNLLMIGLVMWPSFQKQVKPAMSRGLHKWYFEVALIHGVLGIAAEMLGLYIAIVAGTNILAFFHSGCASTIGSYGCAQRWCCGRLLCSVAWRRTVHGTSHRSGDGGLPNDIARLGFGQTVKAKKRKATMWELVGYGITGLAELSGIALYRHFH